MAENIFDKDKSRRLNRSEINQVLHNLDNDLSMLVSENLSVMKMFLPQDTINVIVSMATVVEEKIKSAEKFYSMLELGETVSTESFVRFLKSLRKEVVEELQNFPEHILIKGKTESLTNIIFFDVFINLAILMQISILAQSNFADMIDDQILKEEYERMKREGLI